VQNELLTRKEKGSREKERRGLKEQLMLGLVHVHH